MNPALRVVIQLLLPELWDESGVLEFKRGRALGRSDVGELLGIPGIRVVVADGGHPLLWIDGDELFKFWKRDARPRIVPPTMAEAGFYLDDFPGGYAYIATL